MLGQNGEITELASSASDDFFVRGASSTDDGNVAVLFSEPPDQGNSFDSDSKVYLSIFDQTYEEITAATVVTTNSMKLGNYSLDAMFAVGSQIGILSSTQSYGTTLLIRMARQGAELAVLCLKPAFWVMTPFIMSLTDQLVVGYNVYDDHTGFSGYKLDLYSDVASGGAVLSTSTSNLQNDYPGWVAVDSIDDGHEAYFVAVTSAQGEIRLADLIYAYLTLISLV